MGRLQRGFGGFEWGARFREARFVILIVAKDPQYFESGQGVESFLARMRHSERVGKMVGA